MKNQDNINASCLSIVAVFCFLSSALYVVGSNGSAGVVDPVEEAKVIVEVRPGAVTLHPGQELLLFCHYSFDYMKFAAFQDSRPQIRVMWLKRTTTDDDVNMVWTSEGQFELPQKGNPMNQNLTILAYMGNKNRTIFGSNFTSSLTTLSFLKLREEDSGAYSCHVTIWMERYTDNDIDNDTRTEEGLMEGKEDDMQTTNTRQTEVKGSSKEAVVRVEGEAFEKDILITGFSGPMRVGNHLNLSCDVTPKYLHSTLHYVWTRRKALEQFGRNLLRARVTPDDEGMYICDVVVPHESHKRKLRATVNVKIPDALPPRPSNKPRIRMAHLSSVKSLTQGIDDPALKQLQDRQDNWVDPLLPMRKPRKDRAALGPSIEVGIITISVIIMFVLVILFMVCLVKHQKHKYTVVQPYIAY